MAQFQWRATTVIKTVAPNTFLTSGAIPSTQENWQTADIGVPDSGTWDFFFRDANNTDAQGRYTDANSTRVLSTITQSWDTSVDDLNNLTVRVRTTIGPVVRDSLQGVCQATPGRIIDWYTSEGGASVLHLTDYTVGTPKTLYDGTLSIAEYSFTIAPGQSTERSSLYVHNETAGYGWYDDVWIGVQFRNILPAPTTYRVTYDANGGTGAPSAQEHTTAQSSWIFTVPSGTPTWGLYEFLGWSTTRYTDSRTEADVEYRAGDTITVTQSSPTVTLYAVWRMDYRPGAVLSNGQWLSHNRTGGTAHVLDGGRWNEMRTIGGPTAMGNPPSVYKNGKWYNMNRIGKGGA